LLLIAACGPTAASQRKLQHRGHGPVVIGHPRPAACPTGDALSQLAMKSWRHPTGTVEAKCTELYVDSRTVWLIDGWWMSGEEAGSATVGAWTSLVASDGTILWADGADDLPEGAMDRSSTGPFTAVDFDGDGSDEVIYESSYDHGGYSQSSLTAAAIRDDKLVAGDSLPLSSDDSAAIDPTAGEKAHTCDGKYEVISSPDGTKQVAITGSGDAGDDCAKPGRHVYRWDGNSLVPAE